MSSAHLHVVQISFFVDAARRAPEQLLRDWHSLEDFALAAASAGLRVTVLQASMIEGRISRGGVDYRFVAPDGAGELLTRSARFAALLHELDADVIHVHGLNFGREVVGLRALAPRTPILLQDHADRVPRFWRRPAWRRGATLADGVSFCALEQAKPFEAAGLFAPHAQVFEIPESTSTFLPGDRAAARAATGIHGDPALLWVGHLDFNKDPLTILDGVAAAAHKLPGFTLTCCYGTAPLLEAVQARIARDPLLRNRVRLLGRVPRPHVQELMHAADFLVLGSHREGSGYSVIEALASGLPAVVTDIPSYRTLLGSGEAMPGALWARGDAVAFGAALIAVAGRTRARLAQLARARFDAELSAAAVGRKARAAYEQLAARSKNSPGEPRMVGQGP